MVFINTKLEEFNNAAGEAGTGENWEDEIDYENEETHTNKFWKLFQVMPLRTSLVPSYFSLPTGALLELLYDGQEFGDSKQAVQNAVSKYQKIVWNTWTHNRPRSPKGYKFDFRIETDGIGVSVYYIEKEAMDKKLQKNQKLRDGRKAKAAVRTGSITTEETPVISPKIMKKRKKRGKANKLYEAAGVPQDTEFPYIDEIVDPGRLNMDLKLLY